MILYSSGRTHYIETLSIVLAFSSKTILVNMQKFVKLSTLATLADMKNIYQLSGDSQA